MGNVDHKQSIVSCDQCRVVPSFVTVSFVFAYMLLDHLTALPLSAGTLSLCGTKWTVYYLLFKKKIPLK